MGPFLLRKPIGPLAPLLVEIRKRKSAADLVWRELNNLHITKWNDLIDLLNHRDTQERFAKILAKDLAYYPKGDMVEIASLGLMRSASIFVLKPVKMNVEYLGKEGTFTVEYGKLQYQFKFSEKGVI